LQVLGVKAFGEPVVNLGEQLAGFGLLVLLLPQPGEADSGAEFPGRGALRPGDFEGLLETGLGFSLERGGGMLST
jgi:hypothetical protein